jgi:hypothetical protein
MLHLTLREILGKKLNACSPPTLWAHPGHPEAVASRYAVAANIF